MALKLWKLCKSHFAVFTLLLFLKTYAVRMALFHDFNVFRAMGLELSVFVFVFCIVELLFKRGKLWAYLVLDFLFSTIYLAILLYDKQFNRIPLFYALYQMGEAESVKSSIWNLLHPADAFLFADIAVILLFMLFKKFPMNRRVATIRGGQTAMILVLALCLSGYNVVTKKDSVVLDPSKLASRAGLLNTEAYMVVSGVAETVEKKEPIAITQADIDKLKGITEPANPVDYGVAKGKNLVVVQMESIQQFVMGLRVNGQEVAPNLNLLQKQSLAFDHFNTMIGQGNTNDAEIIVNSSVLPLENGAISSMYPNKAYPTSLPRLLASQGYDTFTMHTNEASFYNRNLVYPGLGYQQFYDKSYFGSDDTIGLGASDEVLFDKSIPLLKERQDKGQPFYANYVTLSSHHPFELPAGKDDLVLPSELEGTLLGNYLHSVHYTDKALGDYFADLKKNGLWDNTVLVLYGDHFAFNPGSMDAHEKDLLSGLIGHTYDDVDMYEIPFLMKVPGLKPQTLGQLGGQTDVTPTLANLFGVKMDGQLHFGQDLLNEKSNLIGERYYLSKGSFLNDNVMFLSDDDVAINRETRQQTQGATQYEPIMMNQVLELQKLSDAYLEQLPKQEKK